MDTANQNAPAGADQSGIRPATPDGRLHPLVGQGERDILITVYIYDLGSKAANVDMGRVMRDLDCSYFSPCELKQRFFTIGTDARATNEQCVERFITALKAAGVDISKHEWSTLPNDLVQPSEP